MSRNGAKYRHVNSSCFAIVCSPSNEFLSLFFYIFQILCLFIRGEIMLDETLQHLVGNRHAIEAMGGEEVYSTATKSNCIRATF
jgi:hypothetical protein